jgi:hypothetical protein
VETTEQLLSHSEIFVEILDDSGATKVFEYLGESIPGFRIQKASLKQKRERLKHIFRKNQKTNRKGRNVGNRFINTIQMINQHVSITEDAKVLNNNEFLVLISSMKHIPDYAKWAYLLVNRLDLANEIQSSLSQKLLNETAATSVFNYDTAFDNDEEAVVASKALIKHNPLHVLIHCLEKSLNDSQKAEILVLCKKMTDLAYHEFLSQRSIFFEQASESLVNAAYALANKDLDEEIRLDLLLGLFEEQLDHPDVELIEAQIVELETKVVVLREELAGIKKEKDLEAKKNKKLNKELETLKKSMEIEKDKIEQLKTEHQKELERLMDKHSLELIQEKKAKDTITRNVKSFLEKFDQWAGERDKVREFAIVYTQKTQLFMDLYPEIIAFPMEAWDEHSEEVLSVPIVYMQRNGCNTRDLMKVERAVKGTKKAFKVFMAADEKALIEVIEAIKRKLEVVNHGI